MFRLNDLRNFLEAAQLTTLSEAARRLGITQPALSESIKRLEEDVGGKVFYRSKSGIALTPRGRRVLELGKRASHLLSEIQDEGTVLPPITLGAHPVVASYVMPKTLRHLLAHEPRARVLMEHGTSHQIQDAVQRGQVDVGVVVNPVANPDLILRRLAGDEFAVWQHPRGVLHHQVFADLNLVQTQTLLRRWKRRPEGLIKTSSMELIVRLSVERLGYGILPERAIHVLGEKLIRVANTPIYRDEIYLVSRPEFGKSVYERDILAAIKSAF